MIAHPIAPLLALALGSGPKFYPDDPILVDRDDLPIEMPGRIELSPTYDLLEKTFAPVSTEGGIPRAMNVNTLGEVPDSSWFENRIGVRDMSLEEIARGPSGGGPPELPLTVTAGKAWGITPGFTVRDARGKTYFMKFDPAPHPNLSTAAEVIGKSFFHAIGYNVPESYIVYLRLDDLTIEPGAEVRVSGQTKVAMDREFLETMLGSSARRSDGSTRAVASLAVEGEALGPFQFLGTRPDDPNDVIPHEHRRELRGYRVFCAWLNHDDSRDINTLDSYVGVPGAGHVRHYLIDFSSTLGSGSDTRRRIAPQNPRAGNEYIVDLRSAWKAFYTLGIRDSAWRHVPYAYPQYAEAGRIESDYFDPALWKPEYPNPAFDRMLADDGFWAAKIVARFEDEAIRAIVATGDFLSREAEGFLADTIIRRRDKVVAHYFRELNPLDGFSVEGDSLAFRNLGRERGLAGVSGYEYEWFFFDNETGALTPLGARGRTTSESIPFPGSDSTFLMVRIRTLSEKEPSWQKAVDVYLRSGRVVGIDREI